MSIGGREGRRAEGDPDRPRRRARAAGSALLVVGLCVLVADGVVRHTDPLLYVGPNIGAGAPFLVGVLAAVAGAVLVGLNTFRRRRDGSRFVRPGATTWVALVLSGGLATAWVVLGVTAPHGSVADLLNGQVGVTVSDTGTPVLVVEICRGSTTTISLVGPNRGSTPNQALATYDAATPVTSSFTLDVLHPPTGWVERPDAILSLADPPALIIASGRGGQLALRQVDFTAADVSALAPGTVLYSSGSTHHTVPRSGFHGIACSTNGG